jgi:hypothetical protein
VEEKGHCTPKMHPNCEAWWSEHHGLGMLCGLMAWTPCNHCGNKEFKVYQDVLQENVRAAVHDLKLKRGWVMQQDNDPKHTSKSTKE